ncbi:spirocyclase AveC family protein [Streptomyces sp. NPDC058614]|uniref:spirocyclase AveC family protein n=1 Tax=Streptomyces sp. NPDC058614 TaxID=3346557 RepID=UPI00364D6AD8
MSHTDPAQPATQRPSSTAAATPGPPAARLVSPATVAAALGVALLLFQGWIYIRWIAAGDARLIPTGDYTISPGRSAVAWAVQGFIALAAVLIVWKVIRDSRRARAVTLNAALVVGFVCSGWQNPIFNYDRLTLLTSQHMWSLQSWGPYIPGWDSPHPEYQAQNIFSLSFFGMTTVIVWPWLQGWITARVVDRRPHWGWGRFLAATIAAGLCADTVLGVTWMQTGAFARISADGPLTLFPGHWYGVSLPYVLCVVVGLATPTVAMQHHARKHNAIPLIFRGSERFGPRGQNTLKLLAGIGWANLTVFAYIAGCALIGTLVAAPMPSDVPSYLWPLQRA